MKRFLEMSKAFIVSLIICELVKCNKNVSSKTCKKKLRKCLESQIVKNLFFRSHHFFSFSVEEKDFLSGIESSRDSKSQSKSGLNLLVIFAGVGLNLQGSPNLLVIFDEA